MSATRFDACAAARFRECCGRAACGAEPRRPRVLSRGEPRAAGRPREDHPRRRRRAVAGRRRTRSAAV